MINEKMHGQKYMFLFNSDMISIFIQLQHKVYTSVFDGSEKSRSSGTLVALGALTIGTVGILAFARTNPDFRATLEGWIPGTDKTIRIIFQEDSNYLELILTRLDALKEK